MTLHGNNFKLLKLKYAVNMARVGLFQNNLDSSDYHFAQIAKLAQWCWSSSLLINTGKTKKLILNHTAPLSSLIWCDQTVGTQLFELRVFKLLEAFT